MCSRFEVLRMEVVQKIVPVLGYLPYASILFYFYFYFFFFIFFFL